MEEEQQLLLIWLPTVISDKRSFLCHVSDSTIAFMNSELNSVPKPRDIKSILSFKLAVRTTLHARLAVKNLKRWLESMSLKPQPCSFLKSSICCLSLIYFLFLNLILKPFSIYPIDYLKHFAILSTEHSLWNNCTKSIASNNIWGKWRTPYFSFELSSCYWWFLINYCSVTVTWTHTFLFLDKEGAFTFLPFLQYRLGLARW